MKANHSDKNYRFLASDAEITDVSVQTAASVAPTLEAAHSSEISVYFCQYTRCRFPADDIVVSPLWRPRISRLLRQFMELMGTNLPVNYMYINQLTSVGEANSCSAGQ